MKKRLLILTLVIAIMLSTVPAQAKQTKSKPISNYNYIKKYVTLNASSICANEVKGFKVGCQNYIRIKNNGTINIRIYDFILIKKNDRSFYIFAKNVNELNNVHCNKKKSVKLNCELDSYLNEDKIKSTGLLSIVVPIFCNGDLYYAEYQYVNRKNVKCTKIYTEMQTAEYDWI